MRCLRIKFPHAELPLLEDATKRFNDFTSYLDDIKIKAYKEHQVLLVPMGEAAVFVESFIDNFPQFSKERIRKDLMRGLEGYLENEDPGNLIATKSLEILKSLVF